MTAENVSDLKIIGIIPARAGSKRLPGKNVRLLHGLPLIAWTLRAARLSGVFHDIIVSTDTEVIAEVARAHGGKVPWIRPPHLAEDASSSLEVLLHAVQAWERDSKDRADAVCLLQPTSPFRRPKTLCRAVERFKEAGGKTVVGVSPAATHPAWCMTLSQQGHLEALDPDGLRLGSQDLPPVYAANGSLYLVSRNHLLAEQSLYTKPTLAVITSDPVEALDIDTPLDWVVAEYYAPYITEELYE